jgi:hypothetical protein
VFNFPRFYHKTVVEAIRGYGYQHISDLGAVCDGLLVLQKSIDAYHTHQSDLGSSIEGIEDSWNQLLSQAQDLHAYQNPSIQAAALAIELFLYLSWRPKSGDKLMPTATELKEALCRLPVINCAYTNLTSYQLMMGALAADKGSQTRAWFVARLKSAVVALKSRGWKNPLETLQYEHTSDSGLMPYLRDLWNELGR